MNYLILFIYLISTPILAKSYTFQQIARIKKEISSIEQKLDKKQLSTDFKELFAPYLLDKSANNWKECWTHYVDFSKNINPTTYDNWISCLDYICRKDKMSKNKQKLLNRFDKIINNNKKKNKLKK